MPEEIFEIVEVNDNGALPLKHQLGKLLFATVVAFVATKMAEKTYDSVLASYQSRTVKSGMSGV